MSRSEEFQIFYQHYQPHVWCQKPRGTTIFFKDFFHVSIPQNKSCKKCLKSMRIVGKKIQKRCISYSNHPPTSGIHVNTLESQYIATAQAISFRAIKHWKTHKIVKNWLYNTFGGFGGTWKWFLRVPLWNTFQKKGRPLTELLWVPKSQYEKT